MQYGAFLRFTLGATSYAWGSREELRAGIWHDGVLTSWPTPQEAWPDQFGLLPIQRFDIEAVKLPMTDTALPALLIDAASTGTECTLELVTTTDVPDVIMDTTGDAILDDTGATIRDAQAGHIEQIYAKVVSLYTYRLRPGAVTLTVTDIDSARLDATYPIRTFTTTDWPELFTEDVGHPVPFATGTAIKVPLSYIKNNSGSGPWVYAACEAPATVLTVYRDGRIVDVTEYTVGTATAASGYTVITVSFLTDQTDPSGKFYALSADMQGLVSRNAAYELSRVLSVAGLAPDANTFAAAAAQSAALGMWVDCRYVEPRTYRAIVDDLALILRGHIYRTANGTIGIAQDVSGMASISLDESVGDLLEITELDGPQQPATIELHYKPSIKDPAQTLHTLTRSAGGLSGVTRYEALYLSDHTAADRLACYLALRAQYGARLKAKVYAQALALGQIMTLTAPLYWSGARDWRISSIQRPAIGADLELLQYDPAIYVYTPGTLPTDAVTGYQPDYSNTPPAVPTGLFVAVTGASVSTTGTVTAWVKPKAVPPAVNWAQMWFAATDDATNEIHQVIGNDDGDGYWGVVIPGLRPDNAYHLTAWAVNVNGIAGEATAPLAHLSATDSTVPAVPTGLTVTQGTGTTLNFSWNAVAAADLDYYEIQYNSNGGAYSTFSKQSGVTFTYTGWTYGVTWGFKVRSVDTAGNASAYCTPVTIVPAANVNTGDITNGGVHTGNIADSGVTTAKRQDANIASGSKTIAAGAVGSFSVTHNLGRNIIATASSNNSLIVPFIVPYSTNRFDVYGYNYTFASATATLTVWYW